MWTNVFYSLNGLAYFWKAKYKKQIVFYLYFYVPWSSWKSVLRLDNNFRSTSTPNIAQSSKSRIPDGPSSSKLVSHYHQWRHRIYHCMTSFRGQDLLLCSPVWNQTKISNLTMVHWIILLKLQILTTSELFKRIFEGFFALTILYIKVYVAIHCYRVCQGALPLYQY